MARFVYCPNVWGVTHEAGGNYTTTYVMASSKKVALEIFNESVPRHRKIPAVSHPAYRLLS